MDYCLYFQAHVKRESCWFFAATIRSFEHMSFDRTIDAQESIFEIFVPDQMEDCFLKLMNYYVDKGVVTDFNKLENRLAKDGTQI